MSRKLTLKMRTFGLAFAGEADGNGTEAARIAKYKGDDATLAQVAYENLRKPEIVAFIESLKAGAEKKLEKKIMSAVEVMAELSEIAMTPWRDLIEIKYNENGDVVYVSLRLADKIKACELVGKKYKLFTDRVEVVNAQREAQLAYEQLRAEFPLANPERVKMIIANDFGIEPQQLGSIG